MHIDGNSRVVVLPEAGIYKIVKVPTSRDLSHQKSMLVKDGHLMELNEIKGTPKDTMPKLKDGGAVKSLIFEGESDEVPGFVVQSPALLVGSPFNISYLLISIMFHNQDVFAKRFITLEDIIDQLGQLYPGEWSNLIANDLFTSALDKICETITENGEQFYKFSTDKAIAFVRGKVDALNAHFKTKKEELAVYRAFKQQVLDPTNDAQIQSEVIDQLTLKNALDFVCNSYFTGEFIDQLYEGHNFTELETWVEKVEASKKSLEVVEENLQAVVTTTTKAKKVEKKGKVTKKVVKKVAVGKGALDGFFKKG